MYSIENTPLQAEINAIIQSKTNPVHAAWECVIITPTQRITPLKFFSCDDERDYVNNFGNYVVAELLIPEGTYTHDLLPYKQQLKIELTRKPYSYNNDGIQDEPPTVKEYRAVLEQETDQTVSAQSTHAQDKFASDLNNQLRVRFQLLDLALEQIRLIETGGIYRNEIPGDVARYMLNYVSQQIDVSEENAIRGIDAVPWDNQHPARQIIIPQGTKAQDVAALIQDDWGGIYNTGCGCYLQNGLWYIWPMYNTRRFESEKHTLTLINVPSNKYRGLEQTYRLTHNHLVAISTGEVRHRDLSHHAQLNEGNATRFTHTDQMWASPNEFGRNFGMVKNNKVNINRADNNSEFAGIQRPNYNVAPVAPDRLSNNALSEASRLAPRQGGIMILVWEHSNPDLIYPGMPTRVHYLNQGEVHELDGVVIKAHHYTHDPKQSAKQSHHITNTAITLFVNAIDANS